MRKRQMDQGIPYISYGCKGCLLNNCEKREQNYVEPDLKGTTAKRSRKKGTEPSKAHSLHPLWDVGLLFGVIHSEWFWLPSQVMLFGFRRQGVLALHIIFLLRSNDFHSLEISKRVFQKPRKKKKCEWEFSEIRQGLFSWACWCHQLEVTNRYPSFSS